MLGGVEGYVSDVFVSPVTSGMGAGRLLIDEVMPGRQGEGCLQAYAYQRKGKTFILKEVLQ